MDERSARLVEVAESVTPVWAKTLIERFTGLSQIPVSDEQRVAVIETVTIQTLSGLRQLLALDPEEQRTNPLTVFRRATAPITALLAELNIPPIRRDEFAQRSFPDDIYGLSPATWSDISEQLIEPGLEWGAWKATVIMSRHHPRTNPPQ
jgi:hypothetical protein